MTELIGHVSPETAYLVRDYPYGFRLRTEIRYWVETKKGHGQRVVSQTRDPKRPGMPWNKPKGGSTYNGIKVLVLNDENGHVESDGLSGYATEEEIAAFVARYPLTCAESRNATFIDVFTARRRADKRVTWTVVEANEPRQSAAEQAEIMRKLTAIELRKLREERV